jgi:ergothioneine biosynthesis protein EgtB
LFERYIRVRQESESICSALKVEDYGIQTMPDVSPPKWHLAHTAWFFETLLLKPYLPEYQCYHPKFAELFNSYYNSLGGQHPRPERGLLARPTVSEIYQYREYVDDAMAALLAHPKHPQWQDIESRTILGLNHEQQHQELLLTDIKHIFAYNPLQPVFRDIKLPRTMSSIRRELPWLEFPAAVYDVGWQGDSFAYDNESPCHKQYLQGFRLAPRLVTNGQYIEFMESGAYQNALLWLSDAWIEVSKQAWQAPLYWQKIENDWWHMTLSGLQQVDLHAPVCHVSYFEADAYARWKGKRLATEAEWELAARKYDIAGNFRDSGFLQPVTAGVENGQHQFYGDVWEWTMSPYSPYPGYDQQRGPLGEYNGKFMSNQMVLRGGSCVTPLGHIRASYRNFFYPADRWQFSGIRLAEDIPE